MVAGCVGWGAGAALGGGAGGAAGCGGSGAGAGGTRSSAVAEPENSRCSQLNIIDPLVCGLRNNTGPL
jgi:hypothetical protein